MPRSKKRAGVAAAKVLRQVIAEETLAIQAELTAANRRIGELQAALASIAAAAMAAQGAAVTVPGAPLEKRTLPAALSVPQEAEMAEQEPPIDLAGDDNLGAGRWV